MSGERVDAVVIGGGLSGLTGALLLAETGRRVVVLEQHGVPGGYLQQFTRRHTVFDVGFHYLGSTAPGRPVRQFLEHLRVWPRLEPLPFPAEAAIEVAGGGRRFAYPSGWAAFQAAALREWPGERAFLEGLFREADAICAEFKWFALRRGRDYAHPLDLPFSPASLAEHLGAARDPWLRQVLGAQSFNLGLHPDEVPWVKHLLAFRSNFDVTSRLRGGGGALVRALMDRGRELGVDYRLRREVVRYECADKRVRAVHTRRGERFEAELFLAACSPKRVLERISDQDLKPMYKERVLALRDSRGAFQLWARLAAPPSSLGASAVLLLPEPDEVPAPGDPALGGLLVTCPSAAEGGPPRLEAMAYLEQAPFAAWRGTPLMKRGPDYLALKERLAGQALARIARLAPELPGLVEDLTTATPLTDEHYTGNPGGGVMGVSHDVEQQGTARPQPRTRLKNLWFSGHSLQMPGICGVLINAFHTAELIQGGGELFERVAT